VTYGFRRTPRSWPTPQKATDDNAPVNPHHRHSSALAHDTAGSSGPGNPRRSVGRPSHTPRDGRHGGRPGRPGTLPPVPGRLISLFTLGLLLLAGLTWQVSSHGPLVGRDAAVLAWFRRTAAAHSWFTTTAHYFCKLGNIQVAVPVLLAAIVLTGRLGQRAGLPRWWLPPAAAALVIAVLPLVVTVMKDALHRPPPGRTVPDPSGYGYFPSGHTATSAVAYGAAALLLLPWVRRRAARLVLLAGTPLLLLVIGCCLVWCDYHWPLDVLASWSLTLSLLTVVAAAHAVVDRDLARRAADERAAATGGVSGWSGSPG
jgi:membrane-associated phospholipid phosphatase